MIMLNNIKILATSSGNAAFPAVIQGLREAGFYEVYACDAREGAGASKLAKKFFRVPSLIDEDKFEREFLRILELEKVQVILPLSTIDQEYFSRRKEYFENLGYIVAVASYSSIVNVGNKINFAVSAKKIGLPIPTFELIYSKKDLLDYAENKRSMNKDFVIKTAHGTGLQGVKIVSMQKTKNFFDRFRTHLSFDEFLFYLGYLPEKFNLVAQEFLEGNHYSVDCFYSEKSGSFFSVRRTEVDHLLGSGRGGISFKSQFLHELCLKIAKEFKLEFSFNVELIGKSDHNAKVIEVNPRFAASLLHTLESGLNLPLLNILKCVSDEKSYQPVIQYGLNYKHFDYGITYL